MMRIGVSPQYLWFEPPFLQRVTGRGVEQSVPGAPLDVQ